MDKTRRDFFKTAGAAASAVAVPAMAKAAADDHDHQALPSDFTPRVRSLESLLIEKGLADRAALDALVDIFEHKIGRRRIRAGRVMRAVGRPGRNLQPLYSVWFAAHERWAEQAKPKPEFPLSRLADFL